MIVLATHHKSGTVLCRRVFGGNGISKILKREFHIIKANQMEFPQLKLGDFVHLTHASMDQILKIKELVTDVKIIHFVRQPRHMLCSSLQYAKKSSEKWLHIKRKEHSGKTLQEFLCSLSNKEGLIYLINNRSPNLRNMMEIQIKCNPYFVKLEELSWDTSLRVYYDLLRFLNIEGDELLMGLRIFCKHALWNTGISEHSTGGVQKLLPSYFDLDVENEFVHKFKKNSVEFEKKIYVSN
jgi:hypothetical protein